MTRTREVIVARCLAAAAVAVSSVVVAAWPGSVQPVSAQLGADETTCDFDGDGFDDLAVGVPDESIGTIALAGAVSVLFGSAVGLTAEGNQLWHQDRSGMLGGSEAEDHFGASLTCGDFDDDGFDDLAVGVPLEGIGTKAGAGAVSVMFGSAVGLTAEGNQLWHQDRLGIAGRSEGADHFGWSLATGDFDGDGIDDLAVAVPRENVDGFKNAGAVQVLFGSGGGLTAAGNQLWHGSSAGIDGSAEEHDRFGAALAAGDFDGDGIDDLAIGVPNEDPYEDDGTKQNAGAVQVLFGSGLGLTAAGNQTWHQGKPGVLGGRERGDNFGWSLASGDLDGDGIDDLAVGVPYEHVGSSKDAGAVQVLFGSGVGLTADGNQLWHQDKPGIDGSVQGGDWFGAALSTGDFDGDGIDDLAVGVPLEDPYEDDGTKKNAGAVQVLFGSGLGVTAAGNQSWHQGTPGVLGGRERGDNLGRALAGRDFDGDGFDDLAVGVPFESVGATEHAGAVHAIFGSDVGLTAAGNQLWHQDRPGIDGGAEVSDHVGFVLVDSASFKTP